MAKVAPEVKLWRKWPPEAKLWRKLCWSEAVAKGPIVGLGSDYGC